MTHFSGTWKQNSARACASLAVLKSLANFSCAFRAFLGTGDTTGWLVLVMGCVYKWRIESMKYNDNRNGRCYGGMSLLVNELINHKHEHWTV
jgi:hypothetical protein